MTCWKSSPKQSGSIPPTWLLMASSAFHLEWGYGSPPGANHCTAALEMVFERLVNQHIQHLQLWFHATRYQDEVSVGLSHFLLYLSVRCPLKESKTRIPRLLRTVPGLCFQTTLTQSIMSSLVIQPFSCTERPGPLAVSLWAQFFAVR
jgi:hypothetical protein